jgi:hypothetical protein
MTQPDKEIRAWADSVVQAWSRCGCNPQNGSGDLLGIRSLLDRSAHILQNLLAERSIVGIKLTVPTQASVGVNLLISC